MRISRLHGRILILFCLVGVIFHAGQSRAQTASDTATSSAHGNPVAPADWMPLLARMWDVGMVALLPLLVIPTIRGVPSVAELFGVMKKASNKLRVIVDRRVRNATLWRGRSGS